jgi:hypothetical protein
MKFYIGVVLLIFTLLYCKSTNKISSKASNSNYSIFQTWVLEVEKSTDSTQQYRPLNYPLPPSRGRQQLVLMQNGNVTLKEIAPACGLESFEGLWKWTAPNKMTFSFPTKKEKNTIIEIISIEHDLLIVKHHQ